MQTIILPATHKLTRAIAFLSRHTLIPKETLTVTLLLAYFQQSKTASAPAEPTPATPSKEKPSTVSPAAEGLFEGIAEEEEE